MMSDSFLKTIFGRLTLDSFPIHEPILVATFIMVAIGGAAVLGALTYFKVWGYLWKEWFTSVDHKKIGVMYMVLGIIMLLRGFADALMMRAQQAMAFGANEGFLPAHHYDQVFTAHGVIMIFFVAMPFVTGLMNYVVPLQIGARDVSFPFLNNFSFWMTAAGAAIVMVSLFVGEFARTGWLAMAPLSGLDYSPDVGVDYYIWGLQVAGVGTLLSGVNLLATIVKMRAPGMSLMKMPIFTWSALATNTLIVAAFPILTAVLALLSLDRYLGTHFFTNTMGGNPMMYVNMIWIWGHPEVYILILPAFGVFSEVTSAFCGKRLFGYTSMVYALLAVPPADFVLHNSLFLIAHFHNVIIGGVLFGMFAGINFWFPKAFGFKLDKFWGTISFWFWVVGFYVAFMPLYVLGLMGVTRRLRHFEDPSLQIWFIVAAIGALLIAVGIGAFLMQIFVSIKNRDSLRDETGDPWQGRSLEWATSSPPPAYNFAFTPVVRDVDAWYDMKANNAVRPTTGFRDIHMPRNTGTGVILAGLAVVFGLAMIWYMWWLAILSFVGIVAVSIGHTFNYDRDYYIPAEEVTACEDLRTQQLAARAAQQPAQTPAQTPAMGA